MNPKIVSVLAFPYANKLEVRVTRAGSFSEKPHSIRVYSASYSNKSRALKLANLCGRLNALVLSKMIECNVCISSPLM